MADQRLSLLDCCLPIVAYLSWLTEAAREEEAGPVRTRFEILFRELDQAAQGAGFSAEAVRFGMFALVAAIDERLMTHQWPGRTAWLREPMQLVFFDTNAAGEEFYLRLDQVRQRVSGGQLPADVLEAYHAMLAMGFQGQLGSTLPLRKQREDLIEDLGRMLTDLRPRDAGLVSIDSKQGDGNILRRKVWLPPLLVVVILGLFIGGLWLWLAGASSSAVASLAEGAR